MLNTRQKIGLAGLASLALLTARKLAGLGKEAQVTRGKIRWQLDLTEGVDFSIYLLGAFEPGLVRAHRRMVNPGDVVLDIGANVGCHTLYFAQFAGPTGVTIAIEPSDWAFGKMEKNISLNPALARLIRTRRILLTSGDHLGKPEVYSSWPLRQKEGLHEKHLGRLTSTLNAKVMTLDELVAEEKLSRVDLIKLDVDGDEWKILQGAGETLKKMRPKIVMEFAPYLHPVQEFSEMLNFLGDLGYRFFSAEGGQEIPGDPQQLRSRIRDGSSENVLLTSSPLHLL